MNPSVVLLCVLLLVGAQTAHSRCVELNGYDAALQPEGEQIAVVPEQVTMICSTSPSVTFPRWQINNKDYEATHLPPGFTADGLKLEFIFQSEVRISCFFKVISNGSVVDICSPTTIVVPESTRDVENVAFCEKQSVTFLNIMDVSEWHVGIKVYGENCTLTTTFSTCPPGLMDGLTVPAKNSNESIEVKFVKKFYGHDVEVNVTNNCSDCQPLIYYISNMNLTEYKSIGYNGTIIVDLSNDYNCFNNSVLDYEICTHLGEVTNCVRDPCKYGKLHPSVCSANGKLQSKASLEITSQIENGTEVSIFCMRKGCDNRPSYVLLFNFVILTCEECSEDEECKDGKCVPVTSEKSPSPSPSPSLSPSSPPGPTSKNGLSPGAIAGIVAAVVAHPLLYVIVGLIILIGWWWRNRHLYKVADQKNRNRGDGNGK